MIYSLDEYIREKPVSLIKVDVEGYEMRLLKGSKTIIKKYKPKLILSAYHKFDDIFATIKFIRDCSSSYKFLLRHHSLTIFDTMLYCFID
jgi:hypothetical protein